MRSRKLVDHSKSFTFDDGGAAVHRFSASLRKQQQDRIVRSILTRWQSMVSPPPASLARLVTVKSRIAHLMRLVFDVAVVSCGISASSGAATAVRLHSAHVDEAHHTSFFLCSCWHFVNLVIGCVSRRVYCAALLSPSAECEAARVQLPQWKYSG